MTGPEHYQKAESLLGDRYAGSEDLAAALAHATLALAAATVLTSDPNGADLGHWQEVAGVQS